jgi:hypothetical protein
MDPFVAAILICLNTVAPLACDETTAADVFSSAYVKTLCRRAGVAPEKPGARR